MNNLRNKFSYLLTVLLISVGAVSCEMSTMEEPIIAEQLEETEPNINAESGANLRLAANLMYEETFEGDSPLSTAFEMQKSTSYGFALAERPVFKGSKSGRIELRYNDPIAHNGTRAEICVVDRIPQKERWYSFAAYFPASGYAYDSSNELISQWHQSGSPALSLRIARDRFYIRTLPTDPSKNWKNLDLGKVIKDTWHEFVIHVVHSGGADALVEVWRNGEKVATHRGPNNYDNKELPYWKLGLYKAIWNNKRATDTEKRVIYLDNIRVGDSNASLDQMTTGSEVDPNLAEAESNSSPVESNSSNDISFTVIDAHLEKGIKTLINGETIGFNSLGTKKLNFKANVNSNVKSVKLELRGASSQTYLDKRIPFSLFGDDGKSNYYFGNRILPSGSYTLTATGYADANGRTLIGESYTVDFNIEN